MGIKLFNSWKYYNFLRWKDTKKWYDYIHRTKGVQRLKKKLETLIGALPYPWKLVGNITNQIWRRRARREKCKLEFLCSTTNFPPQKIFFFLFALNWAMFDCWKRFKIPNLRELSRQMVRHFVLMHYSECIIAGMEWTTMDPWSGILLWWPLPTDKSEEF